MEYFIDKGECGIIVCIDVFKEELVWDIESGFSVLFPTSYPILLESYKLTFS